MKRLHLFFFSVSAGLLVATTAMTIYFYSSLPTLIPTHFGFSGAPDAWTPKNPITAFLLPLIGLLIFMLFVLIYRHPQYTSWPTTLILMAVEPEKREKIFDILRSMISSILFFISLLFAYLQFTIIATANNRSSGVTNLIMIAFLVALFAVIIVINVRMFVAIQKMLKKPKRTKNRE